jgi:hypothetical protein|tara:strand:+ start:542 stop:772 length:231 start_codon:yes stop_codon:yes gene_type:complete
MEIIKNRPMPKAHSGARRIPNDPADLMEVGDSVAFDNFSEAVALTGRLKWRDKKGTLRHIKPTEVQTAEWVVWRIE